MEGTRSADGEQRRNESDERRSRKSSRLPLLRDVTIGANPLRTIHGTDSLANLNSLHVCLLLKIEFCSNVAF
jgi:hypothetical protein